MSAQLRKMEPDEYKSIIKEMLKYVHKVCVENGIHYFAAYGTLLGAVRHNGIIPWDDDVDVWMLGEDYDRFVEAVEKSTSDYYILNGDNSPNYYHLVTRICARPGILKLKGIADIDNLGPFIDIFRLYKAPEDPNERMKLYTAVRDANLDVRYSLPVRYYRTFTPKVKARTCIYCLERFYKRCFVGTKKLKEIRQDIVTQYEKTDSNLYYSVFDFKDVSDRSDRRIFTRKQIEETELHPFEDFEILIPKDYDTILTRIYGDYMQVPPPEKRISKHHFTAYWRE